MWLKSLVCDHSNERFSLAVLCYGTVYCAVQGVPTFVSVAE